VFCPSFEEDSFKVFESQEMSEDHLIVCDGFARENKGERELDGVIEIESVPTCYESTSQFEFNVLDGSKRSHP